VFNECFFDELKGAVVLRVETLTVQTPDYRLHFIIDEVGGIKQTYDESADELDKGELLAYVQRLTSHLSSRRMARVL
jgi:hypothetical protein